MYILLSMKTISRKEANRVFDNAIRCYSKDHNSITEQTAHSVVDITDVKFVWARHTKLKMFEISPTVFVFVVPRDMGYERFEIKTVAMAE